jgi:hypothetical protein
MISFAETSRAPSFEFNRPVPQMVVEGEYRGKHTPSQECFQEFVFDQKIIPFEGGNRSLRLLKQLTLQLDPATLRFKVKDWGIELDCFNLQQLPRELARKCLFLLSAAENERLTEADQADLLRISDYVDYQEFSIDRSLPHYAEGILRNNATQVMVEWANGKKETLDWNVGRSLTEVNVGERFSAFVKLGKKNKTLLVERVSLSQSPAETDGWATWPKKH